jgi:type I restriction enzyme S subunit
MSFDLWKKVRLGEIADIVMGQSPESKYYNNTGQGLPFLQGNRTFGYKYPTFDTYCTNGKKFAKPNDVLLSVRAPVGDLNISKAHICIGRGLASLCMKNGNTEYLFYLLRANIEELISQESGTVYGSINRNDINNFNVLVIDSDEKQREISHILSTLDDKIELNRQTNATLEAIAQAIFKEWFVDFNCPGATGDLVESELGIVPKDWRVGGLGEVCKVVMGQSPPGESYNETGQGVPFFQGRADFGFRFPTKRIYTTNPKRFAQKFDTLVSVRAPVGDMNVAYENCCIGRGLAAVIEKNGNSSFTYYFLKQLTEKFKKFEDNGTVFGSINKNDFEGMNCVVPTTEVISDYESTCKSIDDAIFNNYQQIVTISTIRNILLPKLISGEIEI